MPSPDLYARISWLTSGSAPDSMLTTDTPEAFGLHQRLAPNIGAGVFDYIVLAPGVLLVRSDQATATTAKGQMLRLKGVEINLPAPAFQVYTVRGGRVFHDIAGTGTGCLVEEGKDLFCHSRRRDVVIWGEGGSSLDMIILFIQLDAMAPMLDAEETDFLLRALVLEPLESCRVHGMPRPLSALLRSAMAPAFTGTSRRLYAQARSLEYLSALLDHLRTTQAPAAAPTGIRSKLLALRDELANLEGKVPTLEALALAYGIPARRLNLEFTREFGESIYAFITSQRLDQARAALQETEIPMKLLADRLGYSHVNHFITAFRNRFGVSPGRFRKAN